VAAPPPSLPEADHYKNNIDRSSRLFSGTSQPPSLSASQPHDYYIELPYTLPQDHLMFVILQEKTIDIWKKKLDWIAEHGGMALLNTHTDYMCFDGKEPGNEEYPVELYTEFLEYINKKYKDRYGHVFPKEIARLWKKNLIELNG